MTFGPISHQLFEVGVLLAGGLAMGLVNTLASSGSAISLPLLLLLGLPPVEANATNRIAVLLGALMAIRTFRRSDLIDWTAARRLIPPAAGGSAIGVAVAEVLPGRDLGLVITAALMIALLLLFTKVKSTLSRLGSEPAVVTQLSRVAVFGVGCWIGFLALDANTYLLLVLMILCHFDLPHANALKAVLLATCCLVPVAAFSWAGDVHWYVGLLMSVGAIVGAHFGAKLSLISWRADGCSASWFWRSLSK